MLNVGTYLACFWKVAKRGRKYDLKRRIWSVLDYAMTIAELSLSSSCVRAYLLTYLITYICETTAHYSRPPMIHGGRIARTVSQSPALPCVLMTPKNRHLPTLPTALPWPGPLADPGNVARLGVPLGWGRGRRRKGCSDEGCAEEKTASLVSSRGGGRGVDAG